MFKTVLIVSTLSSVLATQSCADGIAAGMKCTADYISKGSGACAAVMAGIEQEYLNHKVSVIFKNGTLNVSYNQSNNIIEVIGSANYLGEIYT